MEYLTKELFEQFAAKEFPEKIHQWGGQFCYIQAGTQFKDDIHYEYLNGAIYFHIEDPKNWRSIRDFLWDNISDNRVCIEKWQGNKYSAWHLIRSIQNVNDVFSGFREIYGIIEPILLRFEELLSQKKESINNRKITPEPYSVDQAFQPLKDTGESVSLITARLKELFSCNLTIPDYQRVYCWEDKNVIDLWNNLLEVTKDSDYHLGAIILQKKKTDDGAICYDIIDGQQRLVTLTLILRELKYRGQLPLLLQKFESDEARKHIANNKALIHELVENRINGETLADRLIFSVLVLNEKSLDLAYTFFSNQNSKGVPLTDYDLLKAHHLRYLVIPEQAEHLAKRWNLLSSETTADGSLLIERALGRHLLRIRKWMRKRGSDEGRERIVKEEFSAAPIMPSIPPFGERFYFYEKIQGGSHFFAFTERFLELYKHFITTPQVRILRNCLQWESHWRYSDIIESILFGYYSKFGNQYLSEALLCITGAMAQHRYTAERAISYKIREYAQNSELIMMIDQASSPTFFLAEALPLCRISGRGKQQIQGRFYDCLRTMFNKQDLVFSDKTYIEYKDNEYSL